MPDIGDHFQKGQQVATIESVKTAAELNTPITGRVLRVNEEIINDCGLINTAPETSWIVELEYDEEPNDLMTKE